MKKTLLFVFTLFVTVLSFASFPADSVGTTTKNGLVYTIHEITAGETFYALSKKYKVTVEDIQKANPESKTLAIGQKILIPTTQKPATTATTAAAATTPTPSKTHKVAAGEGLFSISKKYGVTVDEIVRWNDLKSSAINVGQTLVVSAPVANKPDSQLPTSSQSITHTVVAGEGLYSISKKYNVTIEDIKKANNMTTDALSVGQTLIIKKGEAPKSAPIKTVTPQTPATTTAAKTPPADAVKHPIKVAKPVVNSTTLRSEEEGIVSLTALPQYNAKFSYGLHKTAPVGTIVKVTNKTTGKTHWVRIMGTLDPSEASVLKVNQTVLEKLAEGATSFEAAISYVL